jgi:hypothetical protein
LGTEFAFPNVMRVESRTSARSVIEMLIDLLDKLDANPDLEDGADTENDTADDEPYHGAPEQQAGSWKGIDASVGGDDGEEVELGWIEMEARFGRYRAADVYEPSLGSNNSIDQAKWSKGGNDDSEEEHDGREPDSDNEPDLDGEGTGNYVGVCSPTETMFYKGE